MLGDPRTVRVTGDDTAAVFRRAEDAEGAEAARDGSGREARSGPVREAYVWCNLTSGDGSRALWLLLLPFMVVNLAHWMRPAAPGRPRTVRLYGLLVRLTALTLTVLLVAAACEVALDLVAWQCAGVQDCVRRHSWLDFLSPAAGGWWSAPGRRLALAAALPTTLTGLLWYLSHRTWRAYESHLPLTPDSARPGGDRRPTGTGTEPDSGGSASAGPEPDRGGPAPVSGGPAPGSGGPGSVSDGSAPGSDGPEPASGGTVPAGRGPEPDGEGPESATHGSALARPGFWYGRRLVARLR
ncbi:hypothetical protein ABZV94_37010, partial [Streptomyces sp. NPDC004658]